jgi:hypothetical protein
MRKHRFMKRPLRLQDTYRFPGFSPIFCVKGVFGVLMARIIRLNRRGKKRFAVHVGVFLFPFIPGNCGAFETFRAATSESIWSSSSVASAARTVA